MTTATATAQLCGHRWPGFCPYVWQDGHDFEVHAYTGRIVGAELRDREAIDG